jgi:hypothetical protein
MEDAGSYRHLSNMWNSNSQAIFFESNSQMVILNRSEREVWGATIFVNDFKDGNASSDQATLLGYVVCSAPTRQGSSICFGNSGHNFETRIARRGTRTKKAHRATLCAQSMF